MKVGRALLHSLNVLMMARGGKPLLWAALFCLVIVGFGLGAAIAAAVAANTSENSITADRQSEQPGIRQTAETLPPSDDRTSAKPGTSTSLLRRPVETSDTPADPLEDLPRTVAENQPQLQPPHQNHSVAVPPPVNPVHSAPPIPPPAPAPNPMPYIPIPARPFEIQGDTLTFR